MIPSITMLGRLAWFAVISGWIAVLGCYSPPEPDCGFVCGPNGECPDDYTCNGSENICHRNGASASLTCKGASVPFDVQSVMANGAHQVSVTFDSTPDATSATTAANYSIPGLTITGTPTLSGATVTLMTSAQASMTYTLTVSNVTRASDGASLTTAVGTFPGIAAFNVMGAMALDAQTLQVTFDAAPNSSQAVDPANYAVAGLTFSGTPTLSGNTVTLTTSTQAAQNYTVTVTGVKRASDFEPLDTNMAPFAGRNAFLVMSAASTSHTSIAVTFSAPPNMTQATNLTNYSISGLTLSAPSLSGSTVSFTTTAQSGSNYTITVSAVTRAADGEPLTGVKSAMFMGRTAFNVASAASVDNTTMSVTFSAAPNMTEATTLSNYNVAGLTLSGTPTLSGNTVTITTSSQTGSMYTVTVLNVTRNSDGEALTTSTAMFTGTTPFDVVSATPEFTGELTITFSNPPDPTTGGMLGNYTCDGGLTFSGTPMISGSTVKLTTSAQTGQHVYTVTVANVTRASDGQTLRTTNAMWTGVACNDSTLDGDETDTDCGGSVCGPCGNGFMCVLNRDCTSNNCQTMVCAP